MNENNENDRSLKGKSLDEITVMLQQDYHFLDQIHPEQYDARLIIGHQKSAVREAYSSEIELVQPAKIFDIFKIFPPFYDILRALWLIYSADRRTCILLDGGYRFGMLTSFINSFIPTRKRKILLTYMYFPNGRLRRWFARRMVLGSSLTLVWSRTQQAAQIKLLNVPVTKYIFIPYKSLHSVKPPISLQIGNFIFSGGNSKRDYQTFFEAVRGTNIPVIVSSTTQEISAKYNVPENVIFVAAHEPAFARLMASSRFVVIPILPNLIRGAGEATVCDSMWHGRAVICADDISAFEYIYDGVTGYVTPPGDVAKLREAIIRLWGQPEKAIEMGSAAHQAVATDFSYELFNRRIWTLGRLLGASL